MVYTFKLRQGVKFQNGKPMSSADVVASFDRYSKMGILRNFLANVTAWEAPDPDTFVIPPQEAAADLHPALSSFSVPVVIIPAEDRDDPPMQLKTIGTGPWQLVDFTPGSAVKLRRYDGYTPNTQFEQRTASAGYKQACFNTVTSASSPSGRRGRRHADRRVAGGRGPADQVRRRPEEQQGHHAAALKNWWIQIATPNFSQPRPTTSTFRKAVQAGAQHGRDHGCRVGRQTTA